MRAFFAALTAALQAFISPQPEDIVIIIPPEPKRNTRRLSKLLFKEKDIIT